MTLRLTTRANVTNNLPANLEQRINAEMRGAIARSVRIGRRLTQANTQKRTGRTSRTVRSTLIGGGARTTGYFGSDDEIFEYLERGTPAHVINPRFKKALHWPGAAHPVRSVQHPGTRPYRQLERSGRSTGAIAKRQVRAGVERAFS